MRKINKKGVFQLTGQVLAIVIVAIIIAVGATILASMQTSQLTTATNSFTNQSFVFSSSLASLNSVVLPAGFGGFSVTSINNFTNNTIGSNNYNVFANNGTIVLKAGSSETYSQGTSPTLNVTGSYIFNKLDASYNATGAGVTGLNNVSSQLGLLGLIIVFAVIIALVLGLAFGRKSKGR